MFRAAKTIPDYATASDRWSEVRPELHKYEKINECEKSGAGDDKDLAKGIVNDLFEAPVFLVISIAEVLLYVSAGEKDEFLKAMKEAWEELKDYGKDEAKKKGKELSKHALEAALSKLKKAIAGYLGSLVKSNSGRLTKVVTSCLGVLKAYGGAAAKAISVGLHATKLSPEWCGLIKVIDEAQSEAFKDLFPDPPLTSNLSQSPSLTLP